MPGIVVDSRVVRRSITVVDSRVVRQPVPFGRPLRPAAATVFTLRVLPRSVRVLPARVSAAGTNNTVSVPAHLASGARRGRGRRSRLTEVVAAAGRFRFPLRGFHSATGEKLTQEVETNSLEGRLDR